MGRSWVAAACLVAGVGVLVGLGWALLVAGMLIYVIPAPQRTRAVLLGVAVGCRRGWVWLTGSRRAVAVASMPPAVVLISAGMLVSAGAGAALLAGGLLLGGLSLAVGWNQV